MGILECWDVVWVWPGSIEYYRSYRDEGVESELRMTSFLSFFVSMRWCTVCIAICYRLELRYQGVEDRISNTLCDGLEA